MSNRPLVYYWIAEYDDNTKLLQFDEKTYKENRFDSINIKKLKKFGLYPFSRKLAKGVTDNGNKCISIPFLSKYEINFNKEDRPIYYRDIFISQEVYHVCKKCNKKFHFSGEPRFSIKKVDKQLGIKRDEVCAICPHCGAKDYYKCKSCGRIYESFNDASMGMCSVCGRAKGYLQRIVITSGSHTKENRWIEYYIGKQFTTRGTNIKFLMKVNENGDTEVV
jgi:hypothetical protein